MSKNAEKNNIYSLSACETSAEIFFDRLIRENTDLVLDVRRRNTNQLCGFTKQKDLAYFVKKIVGAAYIHDADFAPEEGLLNEYLDHRIDWDAFSSRYAGAIDLDIFKQKYGCYKSICVIGAATRKRKSHSDLLVEMVSERRAK